MDEVKNYEVVADRDVFDREGNLFVAQGEVLSPEALAFLYSRKGRHSIGVEFPNPRGVDPPIGFVPSEPIHEQIARMVHRELARQNGLSEEDSLEELDDFEVDDEYDPQAPWEEQYWPTAPWPASAAAPAGDQAPAGNVPASPPEPPASVDPK